MDNVCSAMDLAKYIVTKCTKEEQPIKNMMLQHILYSIQKEFLREESIAFTDRIEAFGFGAAVPDTYYRFGGFGVEKIDRTYPVNLEQYFDKEHLEKIDNIIVSKRDMYSWDIAEEVCRDGGAWDKIRKDKYSTVIALESIIEEIKMEKELDKNGKYRGLDVATYIVDFAIKENKPISYLELQRILYFVNGKYYKENGEFLVKEPFFAAIAYPENKAARGVYYAYGANKIASAPEVTLTLSEKDKQLVDATIKDCLAMHVRDLLWLTTRDGGAYGKTVEKYGLNNKIDEAFIKEEFAEIVKRQAKVEKPEGLGMKEWLSKISKSKSEKAVSDVAKLEKNKEKKEYDRG